MCEYKVFSWQLDLKTDEQLENELNKYAKDGWKVLKVVSNLKGGGNFGLVSLNGNKITFILERVIN